MCHSSAVSYQALIAILPCDEPLASTSSAVFVASLIIVCSQQIALAGDATVFVFGRQVPESVLAAVASKKLCLINLFSNYLGPSTLVLQ